jgi:putative restriction endonuclease
MREEHGNPEALTFESERLLAQFTRRALEEIAEVDERQLPKERRERMVRMRVNQHFFRTAVLSALR